jgi:thymidylate synthase
MFRPICARSLGSAWQRLLHAVRVRGDQARDGDKPIRELLHVSLEIRDADPDDAIIRKAADPEMIRWMRSNFRDEKLVPELGNSPSYRMRLGRLPWLVDRLRRKPETKAATLTTLRPDDEAYVPCVSLLDFKIRGGRLLLTASCRSIDVGKKLPANLVALAELQREVAAQVRREPGTMVVWIASAHAYERDL